MLKKQYYFLEIGVAVTAVIQYEATGRSEVSSPVSVILSWDPSAPSASCCVNKADFSHRFSSQQDVLRNLADVKTLLPSSELVSSGNSFCNLCFDLAL